MQSVRAISVFFPIRSPTNLRPLDETGYSSEFEVLSIPAEAQLVRNFCILDFVPQAVVLMFNINIIHFFVQSQLSEILYI